MHQLTRVGIAFSLLCAADLASAALVYTCDASIAAATCNTLNTTIANMYDATFSNVSADIYITYGSTGLGSSTQYPNFVPYDTYRNALIAAAGAGTVRADAVASLPSTEPAMYNGSQVELSSALGSALGITGLTGIQINGTSCIIGTAGCYNTIVTITNDPGTPLYYRTGVEPVDAYDFFTTVEHETDETLGSSSCIDTSAGLTDGCGPDTPSAVDLFRYSAGQPVLVSGAAGAYFSYDGGVTNGANGFVYNTAANGDDYADFTSSCPAHQSVQDAEGCPGGDAGLDITNDGGAEINILDAVGLNLRTQASTVPEPGTLGLVSLGLLAACSVRRRHHRTTLAPGGAK